MRRDRPPSHSFPQLAFPQYGRDPSGCTHPLANSMLLSATSEVVSSSVRGEQFKQASETLRTNNLRPRGQLDSGGFQKLRRPLWRKTSHRAKDAHHLLASLAERGLNEGAESRE